MEQNFQTSFIPKKPVVKETVVSSRPIGILFIASVFILFAVLALTGGLYFYKGVVTKNIADMENTLSLAKNRFEPSAITKLQVLDSRLKAASAIMSQHITIIPIFNELEKVTMKSVRFTSFGYTIGTDSKINVSISGVAVGYRSIALQSDLFSQDKNFINPIFANLALDNSGNVGFDLTFSVDRSFVSYKQSFLTQN